MKEPAELCFCHRTAWRLIKKFGTFNFQAALQEVPARPIRCEVRNADTLKFGVQFSGQTHLRFSASQNVHELSRCLFYILAGPVDWRHVARLASGRLLVCEVPVSELATSQEWKVNLFI